MKPYTVVLSYENFEPMTLEHVAAEGPKEAVTAALKIHGRAASDWIVIHGHVHDVRGDANMKLELELAHFTGSQEFTDMGPLFSGVVCSEGAVHLAERAGAYWLLDAIASYLTSDALFIEQPFQVWVLTVDDRVGVLSAWTDTPFDSDQLVKQGIPLTDFQDILFTDFPLDKIELWVQFDGTRFTIHLPSEY